MGAQFHLCTLNKHKSSDHTPVASPQVGRHHGLTLKRPFKKTQLQFLQGRLLQMSHMRRVRSAYPANNRLAAPDRGGTKILSHQGGWPQHLWIALWGIMSAYQFHPFHHEGYDSHVVIPKFLQQGLPNKQLLPLEDLLQWRRQRRMQPAFFVRKLHTQQFCLKQVFPSAPT